MWFWCEAAKAPVRCCLGVSLPMSRTPAELQLPRLNFHLWVTPTDHQPNSPGSPAKHVGDVIPEVMAVVDVGGVAGSCVNGVVNARQLQWQFGCCVFGSVWALKRGPHASAPQHAFACPPQRVSLGCMSHAPARVAAAK